MRILKQKQKLAIGITEAWEFFSNPENLAKITPPDMNFEITSDARGIEIYKGMIITYKVSPLLKIRMNWATEISNVEKPHFFVDDQKSGPFKYWHHQHFFKEIEGGVLIEDIVSYEAPILGSIIEGLLVNKRVDAIFEFRKKKLEEIFDTF